MNTLLIVILAAFATPIILIAVGLVCIYTAWWWEERQSHRHLR